VKDETPTGKKRRYARHWAKVRRKIDASSLSTRAKARMRHIIRYGRLKGLPCVVRPEEIMFRVPR
jgi:hypothetical protein